MDIYLCQKDFQRPYHARAASALCQLACPGIVLRFLRVVTRNRLTPCATCIEGTVFVHFCDDIPPSKREPLLTVCCRQRIVYTYSHIVDGVCLSLGHRPGCSSTETDCILVSFTKYVSVFEVCTAGRDGTNFRYTADPSCMIDCLSAISHALAPNATWHLNATGWPTWICSSTLDRLTCPPLFELLDGIPTASSYAQIVDWDIPLYR